MTTDLLQLFPYTEVGDQVIEVDLGGAVGATTLGAGWSSPDVTPAGDSILWADARRAVAHVTIREPAERILEVRCGALGAPPGHTRLVGVRLNHRRIATITVGPTMAEHRIELPHRWQRRGRNELSFSTRMRQGGVRIRVAYERFRLASVSAAAHAVPWIRDGALVVPAGTRVDYFLRVPRKAELHFGIDPASGASLDLSVEPEHDQARTVFSADQRRPAARVSLSDYTNRLVRLGFAAKGAGGHVAVVRPALHGQGPAPPRSPAVPRDAEQHAPVIIYLVDTLRADHLSCYGYQRPTSPHIDRFASDNILFTRAIAQASWTRPSAASVLTGCYPAVHGARTMRGRIRSDVPMLADLLKHAGYQTAGFVTNVNVAPQWGFQRGFDVYRYLAEDPGRPTVHASADQVNAEALAWLAGADRIPFFLYLHVTDPHAPYLPPPPYAERLRDPTVTTPVDHMRSLLRQLKQHPEQATPEQVRALAARYDGEIAFTDAAFGQLIGELRRLGLYDRSLIVFTADHGEEFLEHGGFEHGRTVFQDQLQVPLIIKLPGDAAKQRRVSGLARQIDVLPTILDALGLPIPAAVQGRSLLSVVDEPHADAHVDAIAEASLTRRDVEALISADWKVIHATGRETAVVQAFNLRDDPAERHDRVAEIPVLVGYSRQMLASQSGTSVEPEKAAPIDPVILDRLRALGYAPED